MSEYHNSNILIASVVVVYLLMLPIAMFPEAFVNGVVMTMLVVFKPHWVGSFRDQQYLLGK